MQTPYILPFLNCVNIFSFDGGVTLLLFGKYGDNACWLKYKKKETHDTPRLTQKEFSLSVSTEELIVNNNQKICT